MFLAIVGVTLVIMDQIVERGKYPEYSKNEEQLGE